MRLSDLDARGSGRGGHIAAVALFAIVILVVLFLVVFGASIYRFAVVTSEADDALRATQGYVGTHVQAADEQDAISIGQGPEGTALVITEAGDTAAYEVRIYAYEGVLVEEYARGVLLRSGDRTAHRAMSGLRGIVGILGGRRTAAPAGDLRIEHRVLCAQERFRGGVA